MKNLARRIKSKLSKFAFPSYTFHQPEAPRLLLNIDIVSGCNLRCAACPVGMPEFTNSIGMQLREMDLSLFNKICMKAKQDTNDWCALTLYNWSEPTLHSRLHEIILCANQHAIPCGISSNLNHKYNWTLLKDLDLFQFTVTVSGFTQNTYAVNHKGGKIEPVLTNLLEISMILRQSKFYDRITVRYLVHRDNKHEISIFKSFAEALGLKFELMFAYYMPIDKMFEGLKHTPSDLEYIEFSTKRAQEALGGYRSGKCNIRENQAALDVDGNFYVCCMESPSATPIGNYLDTNIKAMQKLRENSSLCKACMSEGINVIGTHGIYEPESVRNSINKAFSSTFEE